MTPLGIGFLDLPAPVGSLTFLIEIHKSTGMQIRRGKTTVTGLLRKIQHRLKEICRLLTLDGRDQSAQPQPVGCVTGEATTLGFPGEGHPFPSFTLLFLILHSARAVLFPRNRADHSRLAHRAAPLPAGRPVQTVTSSNRVFLTAAFSQWFVDVSGFPLEVHLGRTPFLVEPFVELLVQYGHDLYGSGRPYYHFSETINAVTARKPILRRQVQAAWDVAFTWLAEEPSTHHVAMPPSVLLALLSACLAWGWVREAGIFALCWGALLRVSEATKATRGHLVFPADALWMQPFVLVKIDEPKTRGRAAKHQAAKLEPSDLVSIVSLAFESFPKASLGNAEETFRHSS